MRSLTWRGRFGLISAIVTIVACQGTDQDRPESGVQGGPEIQSLLDALPRARVVDVDRSGIPKFVTGDLGRVPAAPDVASVGASAGLAAVAPVFRASAEDLVLRRAHTDRIGDQHFRFEQRKNGLIVIGGELVVHVRDGVIYAVNGHARTDLPAPVDAEIDVVHAAALALADGVL